ncbi:MAG: META domain-containing protein [Prevotella sp.]|nr:META domain-containing protein [Prevotella sp.]
MKKIMVFVCAVAALASCGTGQKAVSLSDLNGEWNVVKINGTDVTASDGQDAPFIGIDADKKRVYGSTSCNRLTGAFDADPVKGTIDLGKMGSTRMMCPDMAIEDKLLGAFGEVKSFSLKKGSTLMLNNADGKAVIELQKKVTGETGK